MQTPELLLNIYFYIDDYISLSHFLTLNKETYQLMKRYRNITQTHRINMLKRNLFQYLDELVTESNDAFVDFPHHDLVRMYRLYKNTMIRQIACLFPLRYALLASDDITNMLLVSGEKNVEKILCMNINVGNLTGDQTDSNISVRLIPVNSQDTNATRRELIFDVLKNSKYKFVQLNYKYISRIFDSVMSFSERNRRLPF